MSQQLGIVILIDAGAAIKTGTLEGNIHLFDNGGWSGSRDEGTGRLVSAAVGQTVGGRAEVVVLNWLPLVISNAPPTLPQTFFLEQADRAKFAQRESAEPPSDSAPAARRFLPRRAVDILGRDPADERAVAASSKSPRDFNVVIANIRGEAVDLGVMCPAQYGSPDLFSEGTYWSATVDSGRVGHFSYILDIVLFYSERRDGEWVNQTLTLPHAAYLAVSSPIASNGFCRTAAILPT